MSRDRWRVGELAQRAGLTVRTLHHWDEIGLLSPSMRSEAGHRWYGEADVARLQQILSLRQLGLGLERIREALDRAARGGDDLTPLALVRCHLEHLRVILQEQQRLCRRLEALERRFAARPATIEDLLETIEVMTMFEKHLSPDQLETIRQRGEQLGAERIAAVESEWPQLIAAVKAEIEAGTGPETPRAQELARRWMALVAEFTGGDAAIGKAVKTMYQQEEGVAARQGLDPAMFAFIQRAYDLSKAGA